MRGNDAFVEDKIVSKINQSTVVPLSPHELQYNFDIFLWHPDTYCNAVLKGWDDRKQKSIFGTDQ